VDLTQTLTDSYVFRNVPREALEQITRAANVRDFLGGDQLVRQYDRSNQDVFVLLAGEALSRTFSGETVARFGPGSVIGEVALLDGEPRSSNVVCSGACKVAIIPADTIKGLMDSDPRVGYTIATNLARILCMRLRAMNEQVDTLQVPRR
jgi:CRP-like cAMP-binding protein